MLDVIDSKRDDSPTEIEKIDKAISRRGANEGRQRQVAGEGFAGEASYDDLFVRGGHESGGLSHSRGCSNEKGAERVVNSLTLCYIDLLCLARNIFLST